MKRILFCCLAALLLVLVGTMQNKVLTKAEELSEKQTKDEKSIEETTTSEEHDYEMGHNDGKHYENLFFGIQCTLPEEMFLFTDEMIDYENGYDATYLQKNGRRYIDTVSDWIEMDATDMLGRKLMIRVHRFEKMERKAVQQYNNFDEYAKVLIEGIIPAKEAEGAKKLESDIVHDVKLPLETYAVVKRSYEQDAIPVAEWEILAVKDDYFLNIIATANDDESAKVMLELFVPSDKYTNDISVNKEKSVALDSESNSNLGLDRFYVISETGNGGCVYQNPILGIQCSTPDSWTLTDEAEMHEKNPSLEIEISNGFDQIQVARMELPVEQNVNIKRIGLYGFMEMITEDPVSLLGFEPDTLSVEIDESTESLFKGYGCIHFTGNVEGMDASGIIYVKFTDDSMYHISLISETFEDQTQNNLAEIIGFFSVLKS